MTQGGTCPQGQRVVVGGEQQQDRSGSGASIRNGLAARPSGNQPVEHPSPSCHGAGRATGAPRVPVTRRFQDQSLLITGAASGVGAATAQRFTNEGARLLLVDPNLDGAPNTKETDPAQRLTRGLERSLRWFCALQDRDGRSRHPQARSAGGSRRARHPGQQVRTSPQPPARGRPDRRCSASASVA